MTNYNTRYKYEEQSLKLNSVINARELGGYQIGNKKIRHGLLIRSGNLFQLSDEDKSILENKYKISLIFDLRTQLEVKREPDRELINSQIIQLPTIDPAVEQQNGAAVPKEAYFDWHNFLINFIMTDKAESFAREMYPSFIRSEYTQLQYAVFLNKIINNSEGAILWHCTQGKDRTGIGAAFILAALGADKDLILEDFDLSNAFYKPEIERFSKIVRENGGGDKECKIIESLIGVNTDYFSDTLDIIDKEYGSLSDYLINQLSLSEKEIKILQDRYLE